MEHAAKISLINGLAAVMAVLCSHNGYHWAFAINVLCCMMMCFYWNTLRQVIVTSQFLGAVFTVGFIMACFSSFTTLGMYMMTLTEFHFCEFHVIAISRGSHCHKTCRTICNRDQNNIKGSRR